MSPRDHICGGVNYRSLDFTCCEGVRHKGAGLSCCGKRAFSLTQASCCTYSLEPGQLTLNVSQLVSDCCGLRAYDPLNQLCCDSRILNRTQPHAKCCGKEPYDEDNQLCCGNIIEGRKVLAKMSSHHRCCGDHQFNQQSHCCCSETLSPEPLNASCCASSSSNYRGNDASSPNCMPGERPCGRGACFNPTTEGCCENPTSLQGKRYLRHQTCCEGILSRNPCPYNVASCGSQVYNPDINICCAGQISHRVLGKNLCCGKTPYAVEDRRVLCCNQTLHRGVEAGHQCSPGGHLYLPSREIVCESRVHLNNPGKHCCGEETYNPQDEICCNGHKHRRLGNMSCCGGKAYDTSSGQMKCCAGTLYDLQVQGRLTEDAQCCGNILMEAGSTQTCCSAPGLDLLYPTQSGFTCCGHRYPNSSLWSCCAGVLHPRSERNTTSMNMIPGPRLLPLGDLKTEDLCYTEVLLGTVESVSMKMNERSIVMLNAMSLLASRGNVSTLPSPLYHTLPDHCSSPELVPGNTYIWVKTGFISDLSDHSSPLHSILSRC